MDITTKLEIYLNEIIKLKNMTIKQVSRATRVKVIGIKNFKFLYAHELQKVCDFLEIDIIEFLSFKVKF